MNEWTPRFREMLLEVISELHESYSDAGDGAPWPWTMAIYEKARMRWTPPPPVQLLSYGTVYDNLRALEKKGEVERVAEESHGSKDLRWKLTLQPPADASMAATLAWLDS